jgi:hypothetical protein
VQTNLGFFFQDLNQKLKFPTTMSTDPYSGVQCLCYSLSAGQ